MGVRLVLVADDLTGANDTGVQFTKHGLETVVITDLASLPRAMKEAEVVVVDTETRGCAPDTSYNKLRRVGEEVKKIGAPVIYKKIDSTLRGNIGQELDALMDALNMESSAIAPAYPANRRVTVGGYQLVDQVPVSITEASKDPSTPVTCSHVPTLLESQTKRRVYSIGLSKVMDGPRLENELRKVKAGGGVCVLDSATQSDLRRIARALSRVGWTGLISGPAGLASELPEAFGMVRTRPGVAIWGSMSGVAMLQLKRAEAVMEIRAVELDLSRLLRCKDRDE
ncbi:MAG: four-carbon acid sugar kinase family protein, partial [Candidatus Bathyarchaeia archaeon]